MQFSEYVSRNIDHETALRRLSAITVAELSGLEQTSFHLDSLRYVPALKKIYRFTIRWEEFDFEYFAERFKIAATRAIQSEAINYSDRLRNQIFDFVIAQISIPLDYFDRDADLLIFWNGILHVPSLIFQTFDEYEQSDSRIPGEWPFPATLAFVDCDYYTPAELDDLETPCWDKVYEVYPRAANALERHLRNILKRDTRDEQMLMLVGPRQTGKSTITQGFYQILQSLFANTPLQKLRDYGTSVIVGKRAIFCNDHPESELDEEALWFVKNLVEKIPIQVRQIYCPSFTYAHNGYGGILTTNKPMKIPSSTSAEAWLRRMEIEVMDAKVTPDPAFKQNLLREIPIVISQILHWTPPGNYHEYYSKNREKILEDRYKLYKYWSNPCYLAIEALYNLTFDPADCYETDDVEIEIQNWLKKQGIGVSISRRALESQTFNALSDLGISRKQKQREGVRSYYYIGLRLKTQIGPTIPEAPGPIERAQEEEPIFAFGRWKM